MTLARRRTPAVSISINGCSNRSKATSILSRVVPGSSATITLFSEASAFANVDFPTLGRPISATRGRSDRSGLSFTFGSLVSSHIRSSAMPKPVFAEMALGIPKPSSLNSAETMSGSSPSILLTTTKTFWPLCRSRSAISNSSGTAPARASVKNIRASASPRTFSTCS